MKASVYSFPASGERLLADVLDRAAAHQPLRRAQHRAVHRGLEVALVVLGEVGHFAPRAWRLTGPVRHRLEAGQPLGEVGGEPALALLAVVDHVEAGLHLTADALLDRRGRAGFERVLVVGAVVLLGAHQLDQVVRPGDAARVRGQDPVCARLHGESLRVPRVGRYLTL
jgi:hypothetical protein